MLDVLAKSRVRPALNHNVISTVLKFKFDITRGLLGRALDETCIKKMSQWHPLFGRNTKNPELLEWRGGVTNISDACILEAEPGRPSVEASLGYTQDHLRKQNSNSPKWPTNNMYEYHLDSYTNSHHFLFLYLACFVVYFWTTDKNIKRFNIKFLEKTKKTLQICLKLLV